MPEDKLEDLSTKSPEAGAQAREQAKEYSSIFASRALRLDDGSTIDIPPHPNLRMWDEDQLQAYEDLEFETESYDRHPDIYVPEQTVKDRSGNEIKLAAEVRQGALKVPHRKTEADGSVTRFPPFQTRVVQIALGDDDYARLRASTVNGRKGSQLDVWRVWNEQGQDAAERSAEDSKSAGGAVDSAPVPPADPA